MPFIVYMKMFIVLLPFFQMTPSYIAGRIVMPYDSHIIQCDIDLPADWCEVGF